MELRAKNAQQLKAAITRDMVEAAETVFKAQAYLEMIQPMVRKYQQRILDKHNFVISAENDEERAGEPVTLTPLDTTWLMSDEDFKIYVKESHEAAQQIGIACENPSCCPLLTADHALTQAHRALVEAVEPLTGITHDNLFCQANAMEKYKQYIDITLSMLATYAKEEGIEFKF